MADTTDSRVDPDSGVELACWFDRAHEPWNPVLAVERHFDALTGDRREPPALAAFDHLHHMANQAVRWLELNPCPDRAIGRRLESQMMAYRAVADTVRSTIVAADGGATKARLVDLRKMIGQHANPIHVMTTTTSALPRMLGRRGSPT
jgi:hypothetical protein